jgi:hypothetical protein
MHRSPRLHAVTPAYPDLVRSPWARGLLAAGGLAFGAAGLVGCQCLPFGEKQQEPVQEPIRLGGVAPRVDPVPPSTPPVYPPGTIPEVPPDGQGGAPVLEASPRTPGTDAEPTPPAPGTAEPSVQPATPVPSIRGDMPAPQPPAAPAQ